MADSALLQIGEKAPDFTLPTGPDEQVSLSDYSGRPVILAFYPADWSSVCGDQMSLYNEMLSVFEEHNAQLLGISVDGIWSHLAFSKDRNLQFPLLSDFHPKGEVANKYGAYLKDKGICSRSLFVIDGQRIVRYCYESPLSENPGADGIIKALEAMSSNQ